MSVLEMAAGAVEEPRPVTDPSLDIRSESSSGPRLSSRKFLSHCKKTPQRLFDNNVVYSNTDASPVFYNPYPEMLYNFPISSNFLNNRYFNFTFIMQFMARDSINLADDQSYFDSFHISFIIYDLDQQELLLTSTQDVDFTKFGETLPRKI